MSSVLIWVSENVVWAIGPDDEVVEEAFGNSISRFRITTQDGSTAMVILYIMDEGLNYSKVVHESGVLNSLDYPVKLYINGMHCCDYAPAFLN